MAFDIGNMATDQGMENEGVWVDCPGGLRLRIARMGNANFRQYVMKHRKVIQRQMQFGGMEEDVSQLEEISLRGMASEILKDWENMVEKEKKIKYSSDEAYRLLKEYPEFQRLVEGLAEDVELFRGEEEAKALGNSASSSSGK